MKTNRMRIVCRYKAPAVLVNAGETRSVVGSETAVIARALSLLYSVIGEHPGRLTYSQACDVVRWCEGGAA
jgi:hypothetical protein